MIKYIFPVGLTQCHPHQTAKKKKGGSSSSSEFNEGDLDVKFLN